MSLCFDDDFFLDEALEGETFGEHPLESERTLEEALEEAA